MKNNQSLGIIEKLISFDSISSNSNLPIIEYIEQYLKELGISSTKVFSPLKDKANLYASIGPNTSGGVVLSGHTDVVPVVGQDWHTDPFSAEIKDGKLYGRGTCDMKGFVGIVLAKVPEMINAGLKKPIHLAFSYDEEVGCTGVSSMIEEMVEKLPAIKAVIVGEPSTMQVVNAQKGILTMTIDVFGLEGHSSQPGKAVSAIVVATQIIQFIHDLMLENKKNANTSLNMDPPYTTLHVGKINGGTAVNIVAKHCQFVCDIRTIAGDNAMEFVDKIKDYCEQQLIPEMKNISELCGIEVKVNTNTPAMGSKEEVGSETGDAEDLCHQILDTKESSSVTYAAEAGLFQKYGYSSIICGPGSITQAHKPNEFIQLSQIEKCEQFIDDLIDYQSKD